VAHGQGKRTRRPRRRVARRILVVTEGTKTEPVYVEGLGRYLRSAGATAIVKTASVGKDPLKVVQKCVEQRDDAASKEKSYDECECIVDVDEHKSLDDAIDLAGRERITLLISNLKFEVWLRWHAEDRRSALTSSQLDEHATKLDLVKGKMLTPSFPFDKVHDACEVARSADPDMRAGRKGPNPSSAMPILVDLMEGKRAR